MNITKATLLGVAILLAQVTPPAHALDSDPPSTNDERALPLGAADAAADKGLDSAAALPQIDPRIYGGKPLTASVSQEMSSTYTPPRPVPAESILHFSPTTPSSPFKEQLTSVESSNNGRSGDGASKRLKTGASNRSKEFDAVSFLRDEVNFQLSMDDERYILQAVTKAEARTRTLEVWDKQHSAGPSRESMQRVAILVGFAVLFLGLWLWFRTDSRRKAVITAWTVRIGVLSGSFYLHWAFGVFMVIGLYTHLNRSR